MRSVVLFIALVVVAGCSVRQAVPIAAGADLVTTEILIARGGHEANPWGPMQTTAGRVGLKATVTAFVLWACEWLESTGHPRISRWVKWTAIGTWGAAATWNAYLAGKQ